MNKPLEFDGERFTPECVREIWYEHYHRYAFAAGMVSGLRVLDAACGEGYGTHLLARVAQSAVGVDASADVISHAQQRYRSKNLEFRRADCRDMPFDDAEFDCVVSFETLEHLTEQAQLISEFRRVLKADGFLLISSPDKAIYNDARGFENEHHVKELYAHEFGELLGSHFPETRLFGQKLLFHSAIWPMETGSDADTAPVRATVECFRQNRPESISSPSHRPMYLLALCAGSESALPKTDSNVWLFDDEDESVYKHYQHEIRKNIAAGTLLDEREQQLAEAREALAEQAKATGGPDPWWKRFNPMRRRKGT